MQQQIYYPKSRLPPQEKSGSEETKKVGIVTTDGVKVFDLPKDHETIENEENRIYVAGKGFVNIGDFHKVKRLPFNPVVSNLKTEAKMRMYGSRPAKQKKPVVARTPKTDFNYPTQLIQSLIANEHKPLDNRDLSNRHKIAYDLKEFMRHEDYKDMHLAADYEKLAAVYIKEVFGMTLVAPNTDMPDVSKNGPYYHAKALETLGDNKTAGMLYGKWVKSRAREIREEARLRLSHVIKHIESAEKYFNNDGTIIGNTEAEKAKNLEMVYGISAYFGGRDSMRRAIKALLHENTALHKVFAALPVFLTPDITIVNRRAFGRTNSIITPPDSVDVVNSKLWKANADLSKIKTHRGIIAMRLEDLREDNRAIDLDRWNLLDENLFLENHIETLNTSIDWIDANPGWLNQSHKYFADKVSDAVASHRKMWLEPKSLPKNGVYQFKGQYNHAERVNGNDEVIHVYRDKTGIGSITIEDVNSGLKPPMRKIKIRTLSLEDRRRLDLWRQANGCGIYNTRGYEDVKSRDIVSRGYELADGEEFPQLSNRVVKPTLTNQLYSVAMIIAVIMRTVLLSLLPETAKKWEIRNSNFRVVETPDVVNLGHNLTTPLFNAAEVILETVYTAGSILVPAFLEFKNKIVNTSVISRPETVVIQYPNKYFLWQDTKDGFGFMHTIVNGVTRLSETMLCIDGAPKRTRVPDFYTWDMFREGISGYFRVDKSPDLLGMTIQEHKLIPTLFYDETQGKDVLRFIDNPHYKPRVTDWQPQSWTEEEVVAFNSVDTAGITVPTVIDAQHTVLEGEQFDNDPDISEEGNSLAVVKLPANFDAASRAFEEMVELVDEETKVSDLVNTASEVVVPDEIIHPRRLDVKIRTLEDRILDLDRELETAEHDQYSIAITGFQSLDIDFDGIAGVLEPILERLEIKAEHYLGTLFRLLTQLQTKSFQMIILFPLIGINGNGDAEDDLAGQLYLGFEGVGLDCLIIKNPHRNWLGGTTGNAYEQLTRLDYGSESNRGVGDNLMFDAKYLAQYRKDVKMFLVSNAIPVLGKLNGAEETYIAVSNIYYQDDFATSNVIHLPANLSRVSEEKAVKDIVALAANNETVPTMFGAAKVLTPNIIGTGEIREPSAA